jgi:F-type H+-transporting ATPase subunit b
LENLAQLGINGNFLIAQIVNFLVLFFILRAFAYKPLLNMLERRRVRIEEGMKAADQVRQQAEAERAELMKQMDQERRAAQARVASVASESEKIRESILASAQAEAEEIKTKSRTEATAEREQMMRDMQRQIADLAVLAAERILGHELSNPTEQRRMVNDFIAGELK